ncbi:disease resistance protein RPP13-like [Solanum stenotomum]|uniref:disease resistance protein RPP13-like n=1 Tax=Solanum stenotomum TaxID=172797 RepID=UPI0020D1CA41|nr:disease resistance protein RPP13-like [Solanum stenotomum]
MVDAVVSYAVQKLGDFLIEEVSLRRSLRENGLWLRNELSFMQAFLKDAETKQAEDHLVQQWVFEITSVANEAVAVLEAYSLDAAKDGDHSAGFVDRLKACACICQKEAKFHYIGKDIRSLKERVMDISRKRDTYGITHINNNAGEGPSNRENDQSSTLIRTLRRAVSYADEDQFFVGFQEVFQRLLDELLKEESRQNVLSIYGMGGLGKTTLARNLYNSPSLLNKFQTRAWICVSQQYSTSDLLRSIIKSIQGCHEKMLKLLKEMTETDLETHLRNLLKERKYLMVVDDVWHREAWESLKRALPDNNNGSRVILTTRKEDVAERVDGKGFSHKLRFLNKEESWDLLCKKLHPENKMSSADLFSPSMKRLAKEMVEKCRGLPLAIVVLGGLLSYRKGVDEWQKVKSHLWQHMKNDSVEISHILSLSYNDLSFELKQCFLYIGSFQEDHVIDAEKLMHLWLAEGFIPRIREHMEDIAENFLHELISRSLIQVAETFFDKILTCRIHNLLRDLAVQKALEVNLFDIYDPRVNLVTPFRHRHAIHTQTQRYLSLDLSKLKVRSILLLDKKFKHLDDKKFIKLCTTFLHLYVLDLQNIYIVGDKLPDAIGNLVHLKFLGLSNTNLFKLPSSIGKLKNLQTLEALIDDHCSCQLPPQIAKLTNLRHLITRYEVPLQVDRLANLRTLKYIRCDQWKHSDASRLVNLQELGMEHIMKSYSLKSIGSLKSLITLLLVCSYGETFPPLEPLSSCENLQRLWLSGGIEKLANLNNLPKSITVLVLQSTHSTGLEEDPMPILGKFPNLRHLELSRAYKGKKITCNSNSFGQLETLRLVNLGNLESWHLHTTAMSVLKSLSIFRCSKLKKIPERMEHIAVLDGNQSKLAYYYRFPH